MEQDTHCSMMTTTCRMVFVLVTLGVFLIFRGDTTSSDAWKYSPVVRSTNPTAIFFLLGTFSANAFGL